LFLFELLVPPAPEQIEAAGGEDVWDSKERPKLMDTAIRELQDAGVEPDIWKIEGIDAREDCETISATTRRDGRDGVACVVLVAAPTMPRWTTGCGPARACPGTSGSRSAFDLVGSAQGVRGRQPRREEAAKQIAANYRRFIDVYNGGGGSRASAYLRERE
jgi:myo-inositol catabolism protein IolC